MNITESFVKIYEELTTKEEGMSNNFMHKLLARAIEIFLKLETEGILNAKKYEHTKSRKGYCNGTYVRYFRDVCGKEKIHIPDIVFKDSSKKKKSKILEMISGKYHKFSKNIDKFLKAVITEKVSVREVCRIVKRAFGFDISPSHVTNVRRELRPKIEEWLVRDLSNKGYKLQNQRTPTLGVIL